METRHSVRSRLSAMGSRRAAFYAVTFVYVALMSVVGALFILPVLFTGWFQAEVLNIHQFHDILISALVWTALVGAAVHLYRPKRRVSVMRMLLALWTIMLVVPLALGMFVSFFALFFALTVAMAATHPARDAVLGLRRDLRVNYWKLGLVVLAAVPVTMYALGQFDLQLANAPGDEHAADNHWGQLGALAVVTLVTGLLAAIESPGTRFVTWWTALLAAIFGAASVVFPTMASSAGVLWGALALAWAVTFVAAGELTEAESGRLTPESPVEGDAAVRR